MASMIPKPNAEGVWEFVAAVSGNVLDMGAPQHIGLLYMDPLPSDVNPDGGYIAIRTFDAPYVAVWCSELVRRHPAFKVGDVLAVAVSAAMELELEAMRRTPSKRKPRRS